MVRGYARKGRALHRAPHLSAPHGGVGYLYVHADAPFTKPSDLKGKRIGSPAFRYTVNFWLRGLLAEYSGLRPEDMSWVTNEIEING